MGPWRTRLLKARTFRASEGDDEKVFTVGPDTLSPGGWLSVVRAINRVPVVGGAR